MYRPRTWAWVIACSLTGFMACITLAQDSTPARLSAAQSTLRQARQLLDQNEVTNAIILLESQLEAGAKDPQYVAAITEAYRRQFDRLQREGKVPQASQVWTKLVKLQPDLAKSPVIAPSTPSSASTPTSVSTTVRQTPPASTATPDPMKAADEAYQQRNYAQACQCFEKVQAQGVALSNETRERFAYCKLYQVAVQLNALQGQLGSERPQLEREVRAALELAPRLEFGKELLSRLQNTPAKSATTAIKHLDEKDKGWSICQSAHFRVYHNDPKLGEQVAQIAEATRSAVARKWLGQDVEWEQPAQIYVHPTAESYHRQSGMPTTAPGHSDYDVNSDASIIHYRRVFVRADHPHMLTAILPHEVTHIVLNGQFGRKLLPRWADEGMAVLSEPYSRIELHLNPLPETYRQGQAFTVQELMAGDEYPKDRAKMASFYGQSVCLVEYLCTLKGPQGFVAFMRDANREGEAAAIQRNYGFTLAELETRLQQWIVAQRMPTLMGQGR